MKRTLPLVATFLALPFLLVLVAVLAGAPARASGPAVANPKPVSVDYVLALMDEGISQKEIVDRIQAKHLTFRLAPGDIDRLREAGAVEEVIDAVNGEGVVLENQGAAPSAPGWERPRRLEKNGGATAAPSYDDQAGDEADDEGITEEPDGDYGPYPSYGYYSPGDYNYMYSYGYGYPYYYYPGYYYPYRSYYYSAPYHHYPRYSYRTVPRGGSPRGAPRSGSGTPSPRGGGGHRPSPRGSHH